MWFSEGAAAGTGAPVQQRPTRAVCSKPCVEHPEMAHREIQRELLGTELEEWKTLDLGIKQENSVT